MSDVERGKMMRREWKMAAIAAFAAMATGAAQASEVWSYTPSPAGGAARSCDAIGGGRVCATLFCSRSGNLVFGITGLDGAPGTTLPGRLRVGSRSWTPTFVRRRNAPLGEPVWRIQGPLEQAISNRMKRSTSMDATIGADGQQIRFTLRRSRRAIDALEDSCEAIKDVAGAAPRASVALEPAVRPQRPAAVASPAGPRAQSDPAARRVYRRQVVGRWGTRELCRTGGGWDFRRGGLSTPEGADCSSVAAQPGRPPATRVIGQRCTLAGARRGDVTYEVTRTGSRLVLTRIDGARTATLILQRCR